MPKKINYTYFRVSSKFWADPAVRKWNDKQKLLALCILTSPHRTTEGIFRLPLGYAAEDLGWKTKTVIDNLKRLEEDGFLKYDHESNVMFIRHALEYQAPENPNQTKCILKFIKTLPETPLLDEFIEQAVETIGFGSPSGFIESLYKVFGKTLPEGVLERKRAPVKKEVIKKNEPIVQEDICDEIFGDNKPGEIEGDFLQKDSYDKEFEDFWAAYPRPDGKKETYEWWKHWLASGNFTSEDIINSAKNYLSKCRKEDVEQKYILKSKNFIGKRAVFQEYIKSHECLENKEEHWMERPEGVQEELPTRGHRNGDDREYLFNGEWYSMWRILSVYERERIRKIKEEQLAK